LRLSRKPGRSGLPVVNGPDLPARPHGGVEVRIAMIVEEHRSRSEEVADRRHGSILAIIAVAAVPQ
jgi:hypothetical protein